MRTRPLLASAALIALGGCATTRMAVPGELSAAPEMPVHGLQGFNPGSHVRFGEFRVDEVRSGTSLSEGLHAIGRGIAAAAGRRAPPPDEVHAPQPVGDETAGQRFRFRLHVGEGGAAWLTRCDQRAAQDRSQVPLLGQVTHGYRAELACEVEAEGGGPDARWTFLLSEDRRTQGRLLGDTTELRVVRTERLAGSRMGLGDATGFVFLRGSRPVGAVDVLNGGRVRIDPALPPAQRVAIAAAATALLLRADLEERMEGRQ